MYSIPYIDETTETPLEQVHAPWLSDAGIRLYLKRDDLIDPWISGNKWRKLYGYMRAYSCGSFDRIVTWGSPWSNHIHACSILCKASIPVTAIIPEDRYGDKIPSLIDARAAGIDIEVVSRSRFRERNQEIIRRSIDEPRTLFIPEGGSGPLAKEGLQIMTQECLDQGVHPDFWLCAAGVGGQMLGIMETLDPSHCVIGVECVKRAHIADYIADRYKPEMMSRYEVWQGHQGGLGKWSSDMDDFLQSWEQDTGIKLDPLYTGKMLYALKQKIKMAWLKNKTIIAIHSGGLIAWKNKEFKEHFIVS